jgi:hypothetical protein
VADEAYGRQVAAVFARDLVSRSGTIASAFQRMYASMPSLEFTIAGIRRLMPG